MPRAVAERDAGLVGAAVAAAALAVAAAALAVGRALLVGAADADAGERAAVGAGRAFLAALEAGAGVLDAHVVDVVAAAGAAVFVEGARDAVGRAVGAVGVVAAGGECESKSDDDERRNGRSRHVCLPASIVHPAREKVAVQRVAQLA